MILFLLLYFCIMQTTIQQLTVWFNQFNTEYFGGCLPIPRISISHGRRTLGSMACRGRKILGLTACRSYTITISNYYDVDEKSFQNVLLHEMIHYYISYKSIRDTSVHGRVFRSMMEELNAKYGWCIRVRTNASELAVAGGVRKQPRLVLAMEIKNRGAFLSVVNPHYRRRLSMMLSRVPDVVRSGWYISDNDYFSSFSTVRSLRGRMVDKIEYDEIVSTMTPIR
jgi:hypothetical protein